MDSTSPATSYPITDGGFGASGYMPTRASRSEKLMPAALTAIRTSPGPTWGSGRSSTFRTSGGPCWVMTSALTEGLPVRDLLDGPAVSVWIPEEHEAAPRELLDLAD